MTIANLFPDTGAISFNVNSMLLWMWNTQAHHNVSYTIKELISKVLPHYKQDVRGTVPKGELGDVKKLHDAYLDERGLRPEVTPEVKQIDNPKTVNSTIDPILANIDKMEAIGNRLMLPKEQIDNYTQVKDVLTKAGGKYSKNGFTFKGDAQEVKDRLILGEKINDKKKFQMFFTQENEVNRIHELADVQPGDYILEPSAGHGALVEKFDRKQVDCIELSMENRKVLKEKGFCLCLYDFLTVKPTAKYDKILANPPFTKNQDIKHIKHMYDFLKPGGRLVSMASTSWQQGNQKQQQAFRAWLKELDAHVEDVDAGAFKASGTSVATTIIVINKRN